MFRFDNKQKTLIYNWIKSLFNDIQNSDLLAKGCGAFFYSSMQISRAVLGDSARILFQ